MSLFLSLSLSLSFLYFPVDTYPTMPYHAIAHPSKPPKPPFLLTAHHLAWRDIKLRWKRGFFAVFCFFSIVGLCFALYLCFTVPRTSSRLTSACRPDASFSLDTSSYDYWAASGFFQVTLGFGELTFTAAKAIDVVWDVARAIRPPSKVV
jgi:hypothetical protein